MRRQQDTPQVGRLLSLYIDDSVPDPTPFGDVRQRAYKIMPRDTLQTTAQRMSVKPVSKLALHWQEVDGLAERIRRHLRPLYVALDLAGTDPGSPWLVALAWAKDGGASTAPSSRHLCWSNVASQAHRLQALHWATASTRTWCTDGYGRIDSAWN